MFGANPGHVILIVMALMILAQVFIQGSADRKRHQELKEQLNRLEAKMGK